MSDQPAPTLNDKWNKLLADADAGTIDARTAIIGTKEHYEAVYTSNFAAVIAMLEEIDARMTTERTDVYTTMADVRYQVSQGNTARMNNAEQVTKYLDRIWKEQEAAKQRDTLLAENFSALAESVDGLTKTVGEHEAMLNRHEEILQDLSARRAKSTQQQEELQSGQGELRVNQETMAATLARIEGMLLTTEERDALRQLIKNAAGE